MSFLATPAHSIAATERNPLFVAQYPMYNGTFCPHLFWRETIKAVGDKPYREEIWFSMYRQDATGDVYEKWSKPKRLSHKNATIALINYDQTKSPPRVYFSSIYLPDQIPAPIYYAGNQQHTPFLSLNKEELHNEPTGLDIYNFMNNPNHFFDRFQLQLLSKTMLKYFPSDWPEYKAAHALWSEHNPNRPFEQVTWPTRTDAWNVSRHIPPTQIIWTSQHARPHVVENYPSAYGKFVKAKFWIETKGKTKTSNRKEVAYVQYFNEKTNSFSIPKACSPAKATICVMQVENNPNASNFGLPYFNTINLNLYNIRKEDILEFAMNPTNYFNQEQLDLLLNSLMSFYNFVSPEMEQLRAAWANRPIVPPQPE